MRTQAEDQDQKSGTSDALASCNSVATRAEPISIRSTNRMGSNAMLLKSCDCHNQLLSRALGTALFGTRQ